MSGIRKRATILFADIAGYTAMMQEDEEKGLKTLQRFREALERIVPEHNGTIIQFFGDGCLLAFDHAKAGVSCAIALQSEFQYRADIPVRLGLHEGEVLFRDNNAFGDAVNVTSRIESIGVPGAVLVSKVLVAQLFDGSFRWKSLGAFEFKNIKKPMEVFALDHEGFAIPKPEDLRGKFKEGAVVNKWFRAAQWLAIYCWHVGLSWNF
ncbi:MAG: adenylate/guanylate cyclase domain-containing protein [Bacteroidia bacterium]